MRKTGLFIIVLSLFALASCDYRTCPTYTKRPASFEKLQKMNQEETQDPLKADTERV